MHRPRQVRELDHSRYIAMAEAPPGLASDPRARERPFCYRVLVPAVVGRLAVLTGVNLHAVFWATTQLALMAFLFTLFLLLRRQGFAVDAALLGTALASLMPGAVRWYAYQYWMPDPVCLWLVTLGLLLAREDRRAALSAVAAAGAATRENWLLIPAYALSRWTRQRRAWGPLEAVLVFAPAAAAAVAIRVVIDPMSGPGFLDAAREMLAFRARHLLDNQLYFVTIGSFGVLVPLLVLRSPRAWGAVRARPEDAAVALLAFASLAFANNTDRLLAYALPVLLPPALRAVEAVGRVVGWARAAVAAVAAQVTVYAVTPGWGISGLSIYQPVRWTAILLCAVLVVAGAVALRRERSYSS
ncbi:MAG TPA: hypothetical protein VFM88_00160 [Vicinamibacteria bacterium]|nr:hypothetical protein [Vicinamibacteria bacterium]